MHSVRIGLLLFLYLFVGIWTVFFSNDVSLCLSFIWLLLNSPCKLASFEVSFISSLSIASTLLTTSFLCVTCWSTSSSPSLSKPSFIKMRLPCSSSFCLASGYSVSTSRRSRLAKEKRWEYPIARTVAVRLFPTPPRFNMLISPK